MVDKKEEYDIRMDMREGMFIDAHWKDSKFHWAAAKIMHTDEHTITIHFEGWGNDHIYDIQKDYHGLAPFRSLSKGFTGLLGNEYEPSLFHKTMIQEHIKLIKIYQDVTQLMKAKGSEFTQDIRGKVFFYIDSVLCGGHKFSQDLRLAVLSNTEIILDLIIELIIEFMKLTIRLLGEIKPELYVLAREHPNLYLVDCRVAIALSLPEFAHMFKLFFGLIPRSLPIIQIINERLFPNEETKEAEEVSPLPKRLLEEFMNLNGYRPILRIINDKKSTFDIITQLLDPFFTAFKNFPNILKSFISQATPPLTKKINQLTLADIEFKEHIPSDLFWNILGELLFILDPNCGQENFRNMRIDHSILLCKSSSSQIQIEGISKLTQFVNISRKSINYKGITLDKLRKADIISTIFVSSENPEVISRSLEIIKFLLKNKQFTKGHIDLICKTCIRIVKESETTYKGSLNILKNIIQDLPFELIQHLWKYIQDFDPLDYNEEQLKFQRDYVLQLAKKVEDIGQIKNMHKYQYFDLDIFWVFLDESFPGFDGIKVAAMNYLIEILHTTGFTQLLATYRQLALKNIKEKRSFIRNSQFFMFSYMRNKGYLTELKAKKFSTAFKLNNYTNNILENIFSSLIDHQSAIFDNSLEFNTENISHQNALKFYLEFIEFLGINSKTVSIGTEGIHKLWEIYYEKPTSERDTEHLFKSLSRENPIYSQHEQRGFALISNQVAEEFFMNILCNSKKFKLDNLNITMFKCFEAYFMWINLLYGKFDICCERIKILSENIFGISTLQAIASVSKCKKTEELANVLLNQLNNTEKIKKESYIPKGCLICLEENIQLDDIISLWDCNHLFCRECISSHVIMGYKKGYRYTGIICPIPECGAQIPIQTMEYIGIEKEIIAAFEQREYQKQKDLLVCPNPRCAIPMEITNAQLQKITCLECQTKICRLCKQAYHQGHCTYRQKLFELYGGADLLVRACPYCLVIYTKDEGCEHVFCPNCKNDFCFPGSCRRSPTMTHGNHYHRPGCKFFSKFKGNDSFKEKCNECMKIGKVCPRPLLPLENDDVPLSERIYCQL